MHFINYLENTGSSQYFFSSPKTCLQFLLHPREKPFPSGPYENVGARNDSVTYIKEEVINLFENYRKEGKYYFSCFISLISKVINIGIPVVAQWLTN